MSLLICDLTTVITDPSVGDFSPTYAGSSFMSEQEGGGIIDGRYSIGSADGLQDFVRVEVSICMGVSVEGGTCEGGGWYM